MPRKNISSSRIADDPTTAWARDVVEGRVVSGELAIRACRRHLADLKAAKAKGLVWRPDRAADALEFFPAVLSVTAGAAAGKPFYLPSYTTFVVGSLFGWYHAAGRRRFRTAWLETGKGQIKSPMMAAIGLYIMGFCGIPRSEVYAIAKDRNQANVLFQDAVAMCRAPVPDEDESLEGSDTVIIRGVGNNAWKIEHPATGSKFQALAGNEAVSGPRPACVVADEIHEWKSGQAIQIWQAALAKMPGDALMLLGTNTPAADQLVGTEMSARYQSILRGEIEEDQSFAFIARTDPTDDPLNDESCWLKALPCLGLTYPIDNVRERVVAARNSMADAMATKRLYFGIPVGTSEFWISLDAWEAVQDKVTLADLRGRRCFLALDLSQKNDLTALGIGAEDGDDRLMAMVRYWKPRERLADAAREDGAPYLEWSTAEPPDEPLLIATPGRAIEYEFVAAEVQRICGILDVDMLVFDPAHASEFRKACDRIGFDTWIWMPDEPAGSGLKMVIHGQGRLGMNSEKALWMPRSLQQLEDRILKGPVAGGLVIDENPITKWCFGNAAVQPDAQGNRYFIKKRSRGRIDGAVVAAMLAGAAASTATTASGKSFWDTDGVLAPA